jgi:hypothetical protein
MACSEGIFPPFRYTLTGKTMKLNRLFSLLFGIVVLLLLTATGGGAQSGAKPAVKPASKPSPAAVHASAIVIDTHADTTQRFLDEHFVEGDEAGDPESAGSGDPQAPSPSVSPAEAVLSSPSDLLKEVPS